MINFNTVLTAILHYYFISGKFYKFKPESLLLQNKIYVMNKDANFFLINNKTYKTEYFDIEELKKGFSIYEVVKIINNIPLFFEDHLERLHKSAELRQVKIPFSDSEIKMQVLKLIEINAIQNGRLKFAVRFFQNEIKLICFWLNTITPSENQYKKGVKIISVIAERKNPNAKIINYKLRNFTKSKLQQENAFEALLVTENGKITECSRSNIFFIKGNQVCTPYSKDVLPGITRNYVFKICKTQNIDICEDNIKFEDMKLFDSAFISGTSLGILPVKQIDNLKFKIQNNIIKNISDSYQKITEEYLIQNRNLIPNRKN